jgi:hypothetical protein
MAVALVVVMTPTLVSVVILVCVPRRVACDIDNPTAGDATTSSVSGGASTPPGAGADLGSGAIRLQFQHSRMNAEL